MDRGELVRAKKGHGFVRLAVCCEDFFDSVEKSYLSYPLYYSFLMLITLIFSFVPVVVGQSGSFYFLGMQSVFYG